MPSLPIISPSILSLLSLLRLGLGTERSVDGSRTEPQPGAQHVHMPQPGPKTLPVPASADWAEVARLSYRHKVSALAVDGLRAAGREVPDRAIWEPWQADVANMESEFGYYRQVIQVLCMVFASNGLTPIILKGYGLSANYPVPSHRGAGDIDILLLDEDGNPAGEKGDAVARDVLGLSVHMDEKDRHHTTFVFKGIAVENHHNLGLASYKGESAQDINRALIDAIRTGYAPCEDIPGAFVPSATFNAMYLMRHMCSHFNASQILLRQLCDWCCFVDRNHEACDWRWVWQFYRMARMTEFAHAINALAVKYLSFSPAKFDAGGTSDDVAVRLLDAFFFENDKAGLANFDLYYRKRWQCRFGRNRSWVAMTLAHVRRYLRYHLLGGSY